MVRQPIDLQWLVVWLAIRVILPATQIKRYIQEIDTSDILLDSDTQAEFVKESGDILLDAFHHTT